MAFAENKAVIQTALPDRSHPPLGDDSNPLWIRGAFLTYEGEFEDDVIVVHGHTPRRDPEIKASRRGIDTGAWREGALSAVQIDGLRARFIRARDPLNFDGRTSRVFG